MKQALEIVMGIIVAFCIAYIGYFMVDEAQKQEQNYKQIEIDINNDIKPNMSQTEIHNIIEVNCQNMIEENNIYHCIDRYESKN